MHVMTNVRNDRTSIHTWIRALALLACVYFAFHGIRDAHKPEGTDFTIYYDAGRALLDGRDPNSVFGFIYFPFFALCMVPLALLPYTLAMIVWQIAGLWAITWIAKTCVEMVQADGLATPPWIVWAPLLCVLRLADSNFGYGQVNLLVLAVVVAGARAWIANRPRSAGAWIGFAAALKLVPGFLVIVFALRRAWSACAAAAVTTIVLVLLVPAVLPGFRANLDQLEGWWQHTSRPYVAGGDALLAEREYLPGQSMTPVIYRLLTRTPATSRKAAGPTVNVFDLEFETVKWIVRGAQALLFATIVVAILHSRASARRGSRMRELSIAIAGVLALAPLVHKAHMVWLIVPYTVLLSCTPEGMSRRANVARWTLIGLSIGFIGLTTPALFGSQLAGTLLTHNAIFCGLAGVFAALIVDVFSAPNASERSASVGTA